MLQKRTIDVLAVVFKINVKWKADMPTIAHLVPPGLNQGCLFVSVIFHSSAPPTKTARICKSLTKQRD